MPKINPKIFEPFEDPDGGAWIRIKSGKYENVVWRPHNMVVSEENPDGSADMKYEVEFFEGPGFVVPPADDYGFEKFSGNIMKDILHDMMTDVEEELNADSES